MHITLNILVDYELPFNSDICDESHSLKNIERMFSWSSTSS